MRVSSRSGRCRTSRRDERRAKGLERKREEDARVGLLLLLGDGGVLLDAAQDVDVGLGEHAGGELLERDRFLLLRARERMCMQCELLKRSAAGRSRPSKSERGRTLVAPVALQLSSFLRRLNTSCLPSSVVAWTGAASM